MITYFRNQKDLANAVKHSVDSYWELEISEQELVEYIKSVYSKNKDKIINEDGEFTSVLKQRMGKKRLAVVEHILGNEIHLKSGVNV